MQTIQPSPDQQGSDPDELSAEASPRPAAPGRERLGGAGKLYLSPQQAQQALEDLRELCLSREKPAELLETATEALRETGYKQEVSKILHRALLLPDVHPHVGALWVRRVVSRRRWDGRYPRHMDKLCRRGEVGQRAVIEFLQLAGERHLRRHVRRVLRRHGRWLRSHPQGWQVGVRVLANLGYYRKVIHWFPDWKTQPVAEFHLLFCLALALRTCGREKQACEVVRQALEQPYRDEQVNQRRILKLWAAFEEALAGNTGAAAELLKDFEPAGWDEYSTCLYYLARGLIRVQQAEPQERKEAFARDYHRIRERFRITRVHQCGTLVRREYRRCLTRMGQDAGIWGQGLRAAWSSADKWSLLLPLVVVPPFQLLAPVYLFRLAVRPRVEFPGAPPRTKH